MLTTINADTNTISHISTADDAGSAEGQAYIREREGHYDGAMHTVVWCDGGKVGDAVEIDDDGCAEVVK